MLGIILLTSLSGLVCILVTNPGTYRSWFALCKVNVIIISVSICILLLIFSLRSLL